MYFIFNLPLKGCFHHSRFLNYSWTSIINLLISNKACARILIGIVYNILTAWKTIKFFNLLTYRSGLVQFSSVAQSHPTLCNPWTAARQARAAMTGTLSTAKRSYPMSEVRGRSREDPMPVGRRPKGVTPCSEVRDSGRVCRKRQRRNRREEVPHVRG